MGLQAGPQGFRFRLGTIFRADSVQEEMGSNFQGLQFLLDRPTGENGEIEDRNREDFLGEHERHGHNVAVGDSPPIDTDPRSANPEVPYQVAFGLNASILSGAAAWG